MHPNRLTRELAKLYWQPQIHMNDVAQIIIPFNFVQITELLATGGQPSADQFGWLAQNGYEVVINLAMPDSAGALSNEGALVTQLGMDYIHLPVLWDAPSLRTWHHFCDILNSYRGAKTFVHCAVNKRASAFVYLYRVARHGVDPAIAKADMLRVWEPDAVWQDFITAALRDGLP